ncbi:hypothetical protein N7462_007890 [Penicillium macrosclerotiorum]|uniref:uncharacterized protein n=1 Tax=Penicillium macrosclerotiorum TaxID=303699 RepID=UPI002548C17F|nr:uncharacterized protein N7462_007890 [Penicillium macrosclerotiorum]KAJ5679646.1 hypothetical protein N7462_007890 [Penicillium macrosclerotiorum]
MMKAVQLTRESTSEAPKMSTTTLPIPQLQPGHALVRIHYTSIQPSDRLNAQGLFPYTTFPRIPGRDYSGTVIDIEGDSKETRSWIGKEVYGTSGSSLGFDLDGTHAQYCLIPQSALVEKPVALSAIQAAVVGVPFTTALICLQRAQVKEENTVLVLGANGAVGSAVTQMARAIGCKQVLTAARGGKPDVMLGSHASLKQQISALTGGKGVDVVIDTVGDLSLMSESLEELAVKGRYAWITAPRECASKELTFDVFQAYRKEISLLGCNSVARTLEETAGYLRSMHNWVDQGLLKSLDETTFEIVKLNDAVEAGYGGASQKVVIDMS